MLILTRKEGEQLIINDNIVVTLLAMKGRQARIGVEAPKTIRVHRREVAQRIAEEKRENKENGDD